MKPGDPVISELLDRLGRGQAPAEVRRSLDLTPAEYVRALGQAALDPGDPGAWPGLVRAAPRRGWLAPALGDAACAELFPAAARPARLALSAGLLQVHDFWDASHQAAQQADDLGERGSSAYWHGIAHRREPDPGNAAYWFRRVGRHPLFARLAEQGRGVIEDAGAGTPLKIGSTWDPFAFLDFCTTARSDAERSLAARLQRLEMGLLLQATLDAL
jgi:hypothetical protein